MGLEFLALIVILIGVALSFTLKGAAARRARKWYVIGLLLMLGGCFGSLSWLGAETSGQRNFAVAINPYVWASLFVIGMLVMFANSIQVLRARMEQKQATLGTQDAAQKTENNSDQNSREF